MQRYMDTDIAIIGMAGRFPGANDLTTFWDNIRQGIVCITDLDLQQLQANGIDQGLLNDPAYVKRAPLLLDDIAGFDHNFWGFTPHEAALLDPQQRLLLECAWEALEQAGYGLKQAQKIGVFVGVGANSYLLQQVLANQSVIERSGEYAVMLANDKDYAPTRISFKLNLQGPSVSVQTACSTSLVATHMAIQSILNGESEMALAGGAALRIPQIQGHLYQPGMIHSPDGNCKPFTSEAAGTIGSSGAGMVLLKRAIDAVEAGDPIWAVIKGSAINNDGAQKVGFTAPSIKGQAQVVAEALALADVEPTALGYLETHGTATNLGDPIELAALKKVFGATAEQPWCALGTLKANIGHLDNAAGIAGLIKTALALHHRQLPPTSYATIPHGDLQQSPFYLNPAATAWETNLQAGVSSFGIGGTNAHVVLAAAESFVQTSSHDAEWQLLPVSAASVWSLEQQTERLAAHLQANPSQKLADVAYTLQTARQAFNQRSFVVANSHAQASDALLSSPIRELPSQAPKIAWLFSGQGSQYAGMAAELYQQAPAFRRAIDLVNSYAQPLLGYDLRQVMVDQTSDLTATALAQPCLFMLEYALAQQWQAWGIQPDALFGHSIGEYVAACLANVMDLPTAVRLVVARGQLMDQLPSGAMLSIRGELAKIQAILPAELDLAAINTNDLFVVAGAHAAIAAFQQQLNERGIESRRLHTSHAFHSRAMQPMLAAFRQQFADLQLQAPTIPILSNVSGTWLTAAQATSVEYWLEQIINPVQCAASLATLLADGAWIVQELGPGQALATFARASQAAQPPLILTSLPHPQAKQADLAVMLQSLGQLWQAGIAVQWAALQQATCHKVWLPTYVFERQRHWIEAEQRQAPRASNQLSINTPTWQAQSLAATSPQAKSWLIWSDQPSNVERLIAHFDSQQIYICNQNTFAEQSKYLNQATSRILYFSNFSSVSAWNSAADLLAIAKRVRDLGLSSVQLHVVTSQSLAIAPHEDLNPHDASLRGVAMVLAQEYPEITSHWIDLDFTHQAWPSMLAQELQHASEPAVALRGFNRFVPQTSLVSLQANQIGFRVGGCYLITGGSSGLGRQIALQLAEQYQAKVAILSRSLAPQSVAAHNLCQQITELGGAALIVQADVAQPKQLAEALAQIEAEWGQCHGVIHAAGIAGSAAQIGCAETTQAIWDSILAAKLQGTQQLAMMVRPWKLDWAVVMSSLASDLGGLGFACYASANIAQHAIVHQLNQSSAVPWYCINWDGWQSADEADPQRLSFAQGWAALEAIVQQRGVLNPQVVLGDLTARRQRWLYPQPVVATQPVVQRPRSANFEAPRNPLEQQVAAIWRDLLGVSELSIHDNFFDLGGHSLLATQVLGRIRQQLDVDLALQVVFQQPTLAGLAEHIRQQQLSQTLQAQAVGGSDREEIEL